MTCLLGYYGYFDDFRKDDRAIEGLPVRLVIALVVGVASLGVMMNMLSGLSGLTVTELDARPSPDVVGTDAGTVDVTVVDPDGNPVSDATVVVKSATATIDGVATGETGDDGTAELALDPELGPNQEEGTLEVSIKPPAGSEYADDRENTAILVLEDYE
ncbi:Ig-like domain-containing protein [Halorussus salilacus]|uniref:Ig-like domain-containing protein n=1 Tax=Halorussus salilacus TaxID=2953750 RepID=UPI00209EFED9|nr:Ig-like domain-containing protein [Halorussus salilacus]USZ69380.1 Ig-like domain-containing protein [Halorussus salilacus]